MAEVKQCRRCNKTLPVNHFVDTRGSQNPRGHYCQACHLKRVNEWHQAALNREQTTIRKLKIIYGEYWRHYASPEFFHTTLHDERDFCPYCGTRFCEITPNKFSESPIHLDHMDPLDKGGENSIRNVVFCCGPCNIKKSKRSFLQWLEILEPNSRKLARAIYRDKHGHPPEKFIEGPSTRRDSPYLDLTIYKPVEELQKLFPQPIVDSPPSNRAVFIKPDRRQSREELPEKLKENPEKED